MSEYRNTLERELERLSPPRIPFDELARRWDRKRRGQRIRAGMLGLAIVIVMGWLGLNAIRSAPPVPVDDPSPTSAPTSLGIFADVRGWITYGDRSGIWATDPANPDTEHVLLSPGEGVPIAWLSDGSKLLIRRGDLSVFGPDDLAVLNSDGTETLLVRGGKDELFTGGSFTPDGSKVIYASTDWPPGEEWRSGIYVVDTDGGSPRLLYAAGRMPPPDSFQMAVFLPTLSPDGSQIAYFEGMGDWGNSLWVMDADGTDRHQILGPDDPAQPGHEDSLSHISTLQWSPDGTSLAFSGTAAGDIYIVSADGSGLSLADVGGRSPYWSPDASRIAFVRHGILHTMAPDGSDVQSLGQPVASGPWNPLVANTVDTESLAKELKRHIETATGWTISALECPADGQVEPGSAFECTAERESGATLTIEVTQRDAQGNVEWGVTAAST